MADRSWTSQPECADATALALEGVRELDEELAIALLREKSVLVHPGHFFDFPRDGYLVASLITPEEEFKEGMQRILA